MTADPFNLGGGFEDFRSSSSDAIFKFDDRFTNDDGEPVCLLEITFSGGDLEEDRTQLYTCGPGWEPSDDGKRALRADDPDDDTANFNGGTKVGRLITSIVTTDGAADVIRKRYTDDEVGATDAAMFVDLDGTWGDIEYDWKFDGQKGTSSFTGLKEFHGAGGGGKKAKKAAAKKAPAKKAAAKSKAKPKAKEEATATNGLTDEQRAEVKAIYDAVDTPDQFLERVVDEVDGAMDHMDYLTDLEEGAWDALVEGKF